MVNTSSVIEKDLHHIWHPCSQMKDFEHCPPLFIERAQGAYLYTDRGPLIDAISSWWCKSLGHGHPNVVAALQNQLQTFEHVIGANTTYPNIVELGQELSELSKKQHAFFASDGATAVEIAMKLAIHANKLKGYHHKNQFIALKNGYHGESLATMAVSDLGLYKEPYNGINLICHYIHNIPYLSNTSDPLWSDASVHWAKIELQLNKIKEHVCALLIEPIIQGAGGMLCYSADLLKKLAVWAKENDIYLIADEIMTGIGRTGKWFACEHAGVSPDLICVSKGLTSGSVPLSAVLIDHEIFDLFYGDYDANKSFLHSNTFSGNALAVAAALATIKTIKEEQLIANAEKLGSIMFESLTQVADITGKLENVRGIGAVVAADLVSSPNGRIGNLVYQSALDCGALIRPIGNTLYWLPPLNTDAEIIGKLAEITLNSINKAYLKAAKHEKIATKNSPAYL